MSNAMGRLLQMFPAVMRPVKIGPPKAVCLGKGILNINILFSQP